MRSLILLTVLAAGLCSAAWTIDRAIEAVYWSKIAYCENAHIDTWSCGACPKFSGVTETLGFHDDILRDSSGYVAYYPAKDQIIYAFRGTINLPGWIEDFDEFQIPYPNCSATTDCKVHEGLYAGYLRVKKGLWAHLENVASRHPNATLLVTGHSMGAGQSGYAFLDVVLNLPQHVGKKELYNYGCPRLGNQAFVQYMQETIEPHGEHFRHTNFGDPIVHLAPLFFDDIDHGKILGTWLHEPREVFFMDPFVSPITNPPKICNGTDHHEDPTCADSTPWYDMIGFRNHTTYLDRPMGCFLENETPKEHQLNPKLSPKTVNKLISLMAGKHTMGNHEHMLHRNRHRLQRLSKQN